MDYRVIISLPALRDLGEIARFIAEGVHGSPAAAEKIGGLVVVKAQVKTGGRGKAGGVKVAKTPDDAYAAAEAGRSVGRILHDLAQRALTAGKRVQAETGIAGLGVVMVRAVLAVKTVRCAICG